MISLGKFTFVPLAYGVGIKADFLLCREGDSFQAKTLIQEDAKCLFRHLFTGRPSRQIKHPVNVPLGKRFQCRQNHCHGLADARGCLHEKLVSVDNDLVDLLHHALLPTPAFL